MKLNIKHKYIGMALKVRLYEALVVLTLLYSAKSWPLSVTQKKKKLEGAHHIFQRPIMGITWKHGKTELGTRQ